MSGPMKCTHCGALLPPPGGPIVACGYCHAQFQAPALPSGYVWLTNESVWGLLKERLTGVESTYLHPSIPPKKLGNVRKTHAAHLHPEEAVIGIYDGTAFGSATDGFAITVRGLYFKNQMEHPQLLEWQHVREEEVWSEGTAIKVGRASLDTLFGKDDEGLYAWEDVIRTIARSARGPSGEQPESTSAGAAAAVAHAQAWGGPEVLVATASQGWGGTAANHVAGAGLPIGTPRPDAERFAQQPYAGERSVACVDVHPSGEILLAAGDGIIELRYAQNGARYLAFPAPSSVLDARFSPDGSWLLVAGIDNRVSLFDARTGQHRGASPPMDDYCEQVAWLGRSSSFLAASQRGELWVIDAATMSVTRKILGPDPEYAHLGGVAASADGARAFLSCGRRLGAFDVATGRIVWRVEEALTNAGRLAASPRGDVLVMAGYDGVAVIDAATGRLGPRYQFPCASGVAWPEPSGAGRPSLLDKLRGRDEDDFDDGLAHCSWTARPSFSPAGDVCAVQDHVGNLCFIDGASLALHPTPRAYGRAFVEDIAWFPDGNHLLLGASDNSLAVWRVRPLEGLLRSEAIGELPPEAYASAAYLSHDDDDDDYDDDDD